MDNNYIKLPLFIDNKPTEAGYAILDILSRPTDKALRMFATTMLGMVEEDGTVSINLDLHLYFLFERWLGGLVKDLIKDKYYVDNYLTESMFNPSRFKNDSIPKVWEMDKPIVYNHHYLKYLRPDTCYSVGCIYILEADDKVKIGSTSDIENRLVTLRSSLAKDYGIKTIGRIAVSEFHSNYLQNERVLQEYFKEYRDGKTELFSLKLEDVLDNFPKLICNVKK